MNFQTTLGQLPSCPRKDALPIAANSSGFCYVAQGLPEFVGPDLLASEEVDQPSNPQIMIISAAGAVGKSTLARQIAACKNAPFWDLAQAPAVGARSVDGQLVSSFGFSLAAEVNDLLSGNKLFLIVDALDEARIKANEAGFEAFVENLGTIAKRATGTAFVLLGRTQAAETTWLLLEEAGVRTSLLSIQPFTRSQAEEYIELRIKHSDKTAAERIDAHKQPFVEARNLILDHLEKAVTGGTGALADGVTREFLGYAPVLETVAVLLARETNYAEFKASLDKRFHPPSAKQPDRPLAVLDHVVTRLLEREQNEKLLHNIKPALEGVATQWGWKAWGSLYSPEEQRMRLLGYILGCDFNAGPSDMPAPVRAQYEEQLKVWFPDHPFLRDGLQPANKVFESYLFAAALREYQTRVSREVENRVTAVSYRPSRLLADFYVLLGEQSDSEVVPAKHIGLLYDALLAGETDSLRVRLSVECGEPGETDDKEVTSDGEFELVYTALDTDEGEQIESRSFAVVEDEAPIVFRHQLKDASVTTRGTVLLGGDVNDFEIGPSVHIYCATLEIHPSGLVVRAGKVRSSSSEGVVLEATKCNSTISRKPLVRGSLSVLWPGCEAYPWNDYALASPGIEKNNQAMHNAYNRFRRIAMTLRSHGRGSLARLCDKVEHRRVLKGKPGEMLLRRLLADGVMIRKGKFYHWCSDHADQLLRISWIDLCHRKSSPELMVYLTGIITENPGLF